VSNKDKTQTICDTEEQYANNSAFLSRKMHDKHKEAATITIWDSFNDDVLFLGGSGALELYDAP